ncbi:alpha-methylacyl-CoA racemase [Brevipalpus obovatus]|uniref:alpha-methylacyl-CoA racemase n=1 Tax=Brevipalpus obovatus TaxID=246614 RepID=UPI003D9F5609
MALKNIRVIEMVGLAPGPFCGQILRDFGAEVIRIEKIGGSIIKDFLTRGKQTLQVDLKSPQGAKVVEKLCSKADVLLDPFRAGVMERLGLGPESVTQLNKRLIYARLTGYGQYGPLSKTAGHDLNYLAISGVLSLLGSPKPALPQGPVNFLADFAGGSLTCALGICMALLERNQSGLGQVIDANMTEGSRYLSTYMHFTRNDDSPIASLLWPQKSQRGRNLLDGGAAFYSVYETKDGKYMAVAAIEPQFFDELCKILEIDRNKFSPGLLDSDDHGALRKELTRIFKSKTRDEWSKIFHQKDACVTPVLDYEEACEYDHNKVRQASLLDGSPIPAPRLTRTPSSPPDRESSIPDLHQFLIEKGIDPAECDQFITQGVVKLPSKSNL